MDFPKVYVFLITYDRPKEIRQTIYALLKHLQYPRDNLLWHLADDHSPGHYLDEIKQEFKFLSFTTTVTDRKGFGANVNKALIHCHSITDFVFLIEDDRPPIRTIALDKAVALLKSTQDAHKPQAATPRKPIGRVRLDGIAGHWLNLELREAETELGHLDYLHILHNSPFLNVYSNRPAITHRRFWDHYGFLPEGLGLAATESGYAHHVKNDANGPWIVTLADGIELTQDHIGKSRQGTELDKPT